jgi:hypothetical protein
MHLLGLVSWMVSLLERLTGMSKTLLLLILSKTEIVAGLLNCLPLLQRMNILRVIL